MAKALTIVEATTTEIMVEHPYLIITGPLTLDAPDASLHFESILEEDRPAELRRALELGTDAIETIRTSTTLRLVEAEIGGMSEELSGKLGTLLTKDRGEALGLIRELLDDHRTKLTGAMTRYLDPESQASLPVAMQKLFDQATTMLYERVEGLMNDGDDSALGKLADRFSKELERSTATIVEQVAARHALVTRSALSGRPFEDALEERLVHLVRPLGDTVTRCGDTLGQTRRKNGDLLITIDPDVVRGHDLHIVVEAKRRAEGTHPFSSSEMRNSLTAARRNRDAQAGLFVVETAGLLPLGLGFQELSSTEIALAYEPDGDDLALAVGIRLLRCGLVADAFADAGEELDRDAARSVIADVRQSLSRLQTVRGQHQAAINSINKASQAANELADEVLAGLRHLDELLIGAS